MQERLKLVANGMQEIDALTTPELFLHQSAFIKINGLIVGAMSSTAIQAKIQSLGSAMLVIPFVGHGSYSIMDETLNWRRGDIAALVPDHAFEGVTTLRSSMVFLIDPVRLDFVVSSIVGAQAKALPHIDLSQPRELALRYGRINFEAIFKNLSTLIDQFSLHAEFLDRSGLDDTIYRSLAMLLMPELLSDDQEPVRRFVNRDLLDRACQYIQSELSSQITLSNLEHVSGMSRRSLQLAFQKRFDCSPMTWIRLRRLERAKSCLENPTAFTNVTTTAMECGFGDPSVFSSSYKSYFGESPSKTLARAKD
jgi:AraC-like DNA-binding protein